MKWVLILSAALLWLVIRAIRGDLAERSIPYRVLLDLDMFLCALVLGSADMTISSRCGLALRDPSGHIFLRGLGRVLNSLSANHCELAIADDRVRAQRALEILK